MSLSEFNLIDRYFSGKGPQRDDVTLGTGDDCALLKVPGGMELAVTIDTLVAGVHFPENTSPQAIGHKALAVGLSDLAAMGAAPAWATLSLTVPAVDERWLDEFADGLFELAVRYQVALVGGDTVRGPLAVTCQLHGLVPAGKALYRSSARPGDGIYVTGTLGDAGLGLRIAQQKLNAATEDADYLTRRLDFPQPQVEAGLLLRDIAGAAIDISDGLIADLGHICRASGVGATVQTEQLPRSEVLRRCVPEEKGIELALSSGDDYELCFTVAADREGTLAHMPFSATRIGVIEKESGLRLVDSQGQPVSPARTGYDHFAGDGSGD